MQIITHDLGQEYDELLLFFLSDTHIGEGLCCYDEIIQLVSIVASLPNARLVVNGDMINNAIKTSVSDIYSEKMNPDEQIDMIVEILRPVRDKIVVYNKGNHEDRTYKLTGISVSKQVCRALFNDGYKDIYSGGAFLCFLSFGKNKGRESRRTSYSMYGMHGSGGGKLLGSKVNRVEAITPTIDADIYVHSHTHEQFAIPRSRKKVDLRNKKCVDEEYTIVNTKAWMDFGGYGEEYGFKPSSKRFHYLTLDGNRKDVAGSFQSFYRMNKILAKGL